MVTECFHRDGDTKQSIMCPHVCDSNQSCSDTNRLHAPPPAFLYKSCYCVALQPLPSPHRCDALLGALTDLPTLISAVTQHIDELSAEWPHEPLSPKASEWAETRRPFQEGVIETPSRPVRLVCWLPCAGSECWTQRTGFRVRTLNQMDHVQGHKAQQRNRMF